VGELGRNQTSLDVSMVLVLIPSREKIGDLSAGSIALSGATVPRENARGRPIVVGITEGFASGRRQFIERRHLVSVGIAAAGFVTSIVRHWFQPFAPMRLMILSGLSPVLVFFSIARHASRCSLLAASREWRTSAARNTMISHSVRSIFITVRPFYELTAHYSKRVF
jgi:hypothetical protein